MKRTTCPRRQLPQDLYQEKPSSHRYHKLLVAGLGLGMLACGRAPLMPEPSRLANVAIEELGSPGYDRYTFVMEALDENSTFQMNPKEFTKGQGQISNSVPPGNYLLRLNYFMGNQKIYSSEFCPEGTRNDRVKLDPGPNQVDLPICNEDKKPVDADIIINPVIVDEDHEGGQSTFYVKNGKLFDKSGHEFIMRGVNNPHAYYLEQSYQALTEIKNMGFNTVRIVWCADNLQRADRCDPKDMHPIEELRKVLKRMKELQLVAVLNLQNATGSDETEHLAAMVDWYLKPDVKQVLIDYQDILLLNIANEWFGTWSDAAQNYRKTYMEQIPRFRDEGLDHVLIVDARGWGQQFESIPENYAAIQAVDDNLMFSAHLYDVFDSKEKVEKVFNTVRQQNIPFLVGEFGCEHYPGQPVECEAIMKEANSQAGRYGYLAWSFSGNSGILKALDVVESSNWKELTDWGRTLLNDPNGIKYSSQTACFFAPKSCRQ
ncbi:MAG: glycoside hydrolase family 5 protein [Oligoflexus sp.]